MSINIDRNVKYVGPKAEYATLTGSPLWGISVNDVTNAAKERGWQHLGDFRPETIYGEGPTVQHFETPAGRDVIRIPSYGGVLGQDWENSRSSEKMFWILWQAGVKVLLIGGTSGVADWRESNDAIQPGDMVLPWSFRTSRRHRGLPGTEYETSWPKHDLLLDDPFCTELAKCLEDTARKYIGPQGIRRVHTTQDVRVSLIVPDGITFETDYDIKMWLALSKIISEMEPGLPRIATLHGDCVNPVLARLLDIHVGYYHMVANVAQGLPMMEGITESLYRLYLNNFPRVALTMEFELLETMPIPTGQRCKCLSTKHVAPKVFANAMTQSSH